MDQQKPGGGSPGKKSEPRGIEPQPAARDQKGSRPQSVFCDDNATGDVGQTVGSSPAVETGSQAGNRELERDSVMDTGWQEHRGWKVRMVVLGGGPDAHRRAWFAGRFFPR